MKALTIYQPWAAAIIRGTKPIENRTRMLRHRGELAIHAAQKRTDIERAYNLPRPQSRMFPRDRSTLVFGAVIGIVDMVDCVRRKDLPPHLINHPAASGPWCWIFENPRPLDKPLFVRGRPSLFEVQL